MAFIIQFVQLIVVGEFVIKIIEATEIVLRMSVCFKSAFELWMIAALWKIKLNQVARRARNIKSRMLNFNFPTKKIRWRISIDNNKIFPIIRYIFLVRRVLVNCIVELFKRFNSLWSVPKMWDLKNTIPNEIDTINCK